MPAGAPKTFASNLVVQPPFSCRCMADVQLEVAAFPSQIKVLSSALRVCLSHCLMENSNHPHLKRREVLSFTIHLPPSPLRQGTGVCTQLLIDAVWVHRHALAHISKLCNFYSVHCREEDEAQLPLSPSYACWSRHSLCHTTNLTWSSSQPVYPDHSCDVQTEETDVQSRKLHGPAIQGSQQWLH